MWSPVYMDICPCAWIYLWVMDMDISMYIGVPHSAVWYSLYTSSLISDYTWHFFTLPCYSIKISTFTTFFVMRHNRFAYSYFQSSPQTSSESWKTSPWTSLACRRSSSARSHVLNSRQNGSRARKQSSAQTSMTSQLPKVVIRWQSAIVRVKMSASTQWSWMVYHLQPNWLLMVRLNRDHR